MHALPTAKGKDRDNQASSEQSPVASSPGAKPPCFAGRHAGQVCSFIKEAFQQWIGRVTGVVH
jgi:hypothetical protein